MMLTVRILGLAVAAAVAALALLPSGSPAQVQQLSISPTVRLGPEGATATALVTVQCTEGYAGFVDVFLAQTKGGQLAPGFGTTGVVCTGVAESVTVPVSFSGLPLRRGKATATATVFVIEPVTGTSSEVTIGPLAVRVRKP
jgi:hypothetical protein